MIARRLLISIAAALAAATALAVPAASAGEGIKLTPVGRVPFPNRAFVVELPRQIDISRLHVHVRENGVPVKNPTIAPVGASGIRFGSVLVIDSSLSMKGKPFAAALDAARAFVQRRAPSELVGIIMFNDRVQVVQPLTRSGARSTRRSQRAAARLRDAHIRRSRPRARRARAGQDLCRVSRPALGRRRRRQHVDARRGDRPSEARSISRVHRGTAVRRFDVLPLNKVATATGGSFTAATSTSRLAQIYGEISGRLASEYLLNYRSNAKPGDAVQVTAGIEGLGAGAAQYTSPTPSGLKPFHQSLASRFLLSPLSLVLMAMLAAALIGGALLAILRRAPGTNVAERIGAFGAMPQAGAPVPEPRRRRVRRGETKSFLVKWWTRLERNFEIGEISITPQMYTLVMFAGTLLAAIVLTAIASPLIVLAALVPVFLNSWVKRRVKRVRDTFADQLPEMLQLLASALRSGHSLIGALKVVVESAPEPTKREFGQIVTDDQIGLPIEESALRVADRMQSRDMVQVALIAELQRTAGGNAADVLDTVVSTVRERADVRRLARTLTVQGRMARWILTILPIVLALLMLLLMPTVTKPLFQSSGGQIALVFAALLVVVGSFWIQKIVEIEV